MHLMRIFAVMALATLLAVTTNADTNNRFNIDTYLAVKSISSITASPDGEHLAYTFSRIKSAATEVIGHHDEEGIARFLRERFSL